MGHCTIHNQTYDENKDGFCPYCGVPQPRTITTSTLNVCTECGHKNPLHFDGCSLKTTAG